MVSFLVAARGGGVEPTTCCISPATGPFLCKNDWDPIHRGHGMPNSAVTPEPARDRRTVEPARPLVAGAHEIAHSGSNHALASTKGQHGFSGLRLIDCLFVCLPCLLACVTDAQTRRHRHTHTETQTYRHRHTDTDTQTQTHRHADTDTHTHTETQTYRHRHTDTDTQTHGHKDTKTREPLCFFGHIRCQSCKDFHGM